VDAGWLNKDNLLGRLSSWNLQGMHFVLNDIIRCNLAEDVKFSIGSSYSTGTTVFLEKTFRFIFSDFSW
jgi:hypothetical protein